ncbi:Na+/H+ antiporter subunit E [Algiphilus sp.]|uniref:Na+/H+ antiporter subunit E n=1 Tax=Algiphilus sp. TaxID=1872431 RepID=UPI0025C1D22D|nr:Na+/H+ antiporter subunit E [Algiphilus sp.]MCK5770750.1 Na+/H+ antiporter subunit E [Algiphilus sp.]
MTGFVFNVMLMLAWAAITGLFSLGNLVTGFVLGYLIIAFALGSEDNYRAYVRKVPLSVAFAGYFLKELLMSNLRVAYDVLTPTHLMRPAVIRMPMRARSPAEITMLANLISLTPGTLSMEIDEEAFVLYVHVMYLDGDDDTLRELQDLERRVLELLR